MCLCILDEDMATFLKVAISVDIGQVRKPEVIDHYPFNGAQSCDIVFENSESKSEE